jgi:transcription elongation factor Elf1
MLKLPVKTCNACGVSKTIDAFWVDKRNKDGRQGKCRTCYSKEKPGVKARLRNSILIKEYLGGEFKCKHCGFTHSSSVPFDFHHIDPTTKEFNVGHKTAGGWEALKKEIDKCVFLCKNCHAIEHERLRNVINKTNN